MKPETPNSNSAVHPDPVEVAPNDAPDLVAVPAKNDLLLCRHRTVQGRRCRLRVLNPQSRLCFRHAQLRRQKHRAVDLSAELTAGLSEFKSALPINDFLSRLLLFQAEDRISPRRAAVMAYTCNLLLRTLPAINAELNAEADAEPQIIFDMPRPNRENHETSDTLTLIQNISSANCHRGEEAPGKKLS